jgi:hypothetical protein
MTTSPAETATSPPPPKLDLSPTKILASALAAISTAIAASYLGAMGTIIGAGVGSILASVTTALYHQSLRRTGEKLKQVVPLSTVVIRHRPDAPPAPHDAADVPDVEPDPHKTARSGTDPDETAVLEVSPQGDLAPAAPEQRPGLAGLLQSVRWGRVLATAAVIFVISFGALLAYETLIGKSLSAAVQGKQSSGNTWQDVVTPKKQSPSPAVTPSYPPSAEPSPSAPPSAETTPSSQPSSQPSSAPPASQGPADAPVTIEPSVPSGGGSVRPQAPANDAPPPPATQP